MKTEMTRIRESKLEKSHTGRLFRCSLALLTLCGGMSSALAGPPSKSQDQDVLLADALILAQGHYCSVVNHSDRNIEFTIGIWNDTGILLTGTTVFVSPGYRANVPYSSGDTSSTYCTVSFFGQKSEARAAHCGLTEDPDTYKFSSQACLPLD
jgi:hypothetical protein